MNPVKIGIIGCGYWGPKLARNLDQLADAELTWAVDTRADRLSQMKELYPSISITKDYRRMLDSDVDAVVVSTPVMTHHPLAIESLKAGKHVLVEKPLAARVSDAVDIAKTAEQRGLVAMVGHTFQYNPVVNVMRDLILSGELGTIYYINSARVNLGLFQPDVNVMWDLAPHDISIILHILDLDPVHVRAYGSVCVQRERSIHDIAYVSMQFPNGVLANLHLSWLDPVKTRKMTIVGSKKMLVYDDAADDKLILFDKGVEVLPSPDTLEQFHMYYRNGCQTRVPYEWKEPLSVECDAFLAWITQGRCAPSNAWFGVRVVEILETAQKSLLDGGYVQRIETRKTQIQSGLPRTSSSGEMSNSTPL